MEEQNLTESQKQELLNEEVLDEEVREILERLSSAELGGSELATIGAIAEATGASPNLIGRMLAEIRQENLDERFGKTLRKHQDTLETHSAKIARHGEELQKIKVAGARDSDAVGEYSEEVEEELAKMAEERIRHREMQPYVVMIAFVIFALVALATCTQSGSAGLSEFPTGPRTRYSSTTLPDGTVLTVDQDLNVSARTKDGIVRPIKPEEKDEAAMLQVSMSQSLENERR